MSHLTVRAKTSGCWHIRRKIKYDPGSMMLIISPFPVYSSKNVVSTVQTSFHTWHSWLMVAGRGSRLKSRGRGFEVAVAGPKSRVRKMIFVKLKLEFEVTEWKWLIKWSWKNRFYARYSSVANLLVTNVRESVEYCLKKRPQEKAGRLLCFLSIGSRYVYIQLWIHLCI